jgi:hypothetical protein
MPEEDVLSTDGPNGPNRPGGEGPSDQERPEHDSDHRTTPLVPEADSNRVLEFVNKILSLGVNGFGPYKSATQMAERALNTHGDREIAIRRLIATHRRWVGSSGFATGLGGLAGLPVAVPTDVTVFYMLSGRMSAAIAILRGYDINSEEVQSAVLISLLGASAAGALGGLGVEVGTKAALAGLRKLPGRVLIDINKKVGFRLLTKFGTKGAINLVRGIPPGGRWRRSRSERGRDQPDREVCEDNIRSARQRG